MLKKVKILYGLAVLAIVATAAWNVNYNSQIKGMSDLALVKTEALADNEGGGGYEYNLEEGDCSITVEGEAGYKFTILGREWTIPLSGKITITFDDVKISCSTGGSYQCSQVTCADFWKG